MGDAAKQVCAADPAAHLGMDDLDLIQTHKNLSHLLLGLRSETSIAEMNDRICLDIGAKHPA